MSKKTKAEPSAPLKAGYNPDVLSCLANLSNDEVFTPPEVANAMLDLLPQKIFSDPNAKFLDPACKSGVFLREIAKRLIAGLADKIPDLQKRIDHIFKEQLYAIAITKLTSLLSRRSVYCSKDASGKYSVSKFKGEQGNIFYKPTKHLWINGKCLECGASQSEYGDEERQGLESHAYQFIHKAMPGELENMKFDVIIGNPPYQLGVGNEGGNSSKAKAIYHLFISEAIKLKPRYLVMITPSRWMTKQTEGIPDEWVENQIHSNHYVIIHDFEEATDCFPGVEIKGGVNYFLYATNYSGKCDYYFHQKGISRSLKRNDYLDSKNAGIILRDPKAYSIIEKIVSLEGNYFIDMKNNFSGFISPKDFYTNKQKLMSSWSGFKNEKDDSHYIKYYLNKNIHKIDFAWISENDIPKNIETKDFHKVYIPAAGGSGNDDIVLGKPFYGEPNSVCSQTYLVIGYDKSHNLTKENCKNIITYIKTKFFRYLVSIKKKTQNGPRGVYQFVPMQDFSKPWTDQELYKKYNLSQEEINFIESMIRPME